ncbi:SGNH/GDSL hydrolase family protein [Actinacidiphila sp. ITFR-21]|uniref:SGNH/GDSL hydrolase family protein n=1 Tax=Actinacidiphila sp. ITFR-21 TaxID=3075199 RepID=UPI00288BB87A|nr:SGNH/GDSL hydrolase family protein [Streptomyces sp. ITFR-21]WNI14885.1 SGNH/GDSL hydrolase family protein [Streptomyces sp. ITFR-21]
MKRPGRVSAAFALILTFALSLFGAGTARSAGPNFVALGDSYASGVGSGAYDGASGACRRSVKAYPALWAAAHAPTSFAFTACSGARTADVVNSQLGPVNAATGLISVTVGGNDASFSDVMTTCVLDSQTACLNRIAQARTFVDKTLPGRLDAAYDAIRAKGPHAHVVVVGYPRFYQVPGRCLVGIGDTARNAVNAAADELDTVIAKRAADHGFTFADVRTAFTKHELCSASPWLHSLTLPVDDSYHPTAAGQAGGYLPRFGAAA